MDGQEPVAVAAEGRDKGQSDSDVSKSTPACDSTHCLDRHSSLSSVSRVRVRSKPSERSDGSASASLSNRQTSAAAGLAKEGKLAVFGTCATFAAARNLDQIGTSICYGNFSVMIAGTHGGVSVVPDGATHQALGDLFAMCGCAAQHDGCGSLRRGGDPQGHGFPAAQTPGTEVHPFCPRCNPVVTREEANFGVNCLFFSVVCREVRRPAPSQPERR